MPTPRNTQRILAASTLACAVLAGLTVLTARPAPTHAEDDIPTNAAGERHGRVTLEHPNGETHILAAYRSGLLHGTYREFNDAGQLTLQATFHEGQLHGRLERRTDEGQRLEIARYQEGQRQGTRQVFRDGAIVLTETYEDGQRTTQEGDASADPGPPTFGIGTDGLAGGAPDPALPSDEAPAPNEPAPIGQRPEHQRDTSRTPNGYPHSIDDLTRAFGRIDNLRIEGAPDEQQATAIRRLIKYRLLSGLEDPIVAFDEDEAMLAQRSSEVCHAIGRIDHFPPNPGMPDGDYAQAAEGARRSNLVGPSTIDPATAVEIWMVDYGSNNSDEVGHRRWCLAPGLYETAYGEHEGYHSLLVGGNTHDRGQFDMLAFPGAGYQPAEYFDFIHRINAENLIWTLHLNPRTYQTPERAELVHISVWRVLPSGERFEAEVSRVHLPEGDFGLDAILFDPEIEQIVAGEIFEVVVEGIERRRRPHTITYRVEFFELGDED
ncbi:hypothetical protein OT109_02660 [Phycisphaeraceae bacterium D3-23]